MLPSALTLESAPDTTSDAITSLQEVASSYKSNFEADWKDIRTPLNTWFRSDFMPSDAFKKPSMANFSTCLETIETSLVPSYFHKLCDEGKPVKEALGQARELSFFARQSAVALILDSEQLAEQEKNSIASLHLLLTLGDMSRPRDSFHVFTSMENQDFINLRCELLKEVADFGWQYPQDFEHVMVAGKKLGDSISAYAKHMPDFSNDEQSALMDDLSDNVRINRGRRAGIRGEVLSAIAVESVLKYSINLNETAKSLGIKHLRVQQATAAVDAMGIADLVITGDVGGVEQPLVVIDVKAEFDDTSMDAWIVHDNAKKTAENKSDTRPETITKISGYLQNARGSEAVACFVTVPTAKIPDSSAYNIETDGDDSSKDFPNSHFVKETGIPGVSIRIPYLWVAEGGDCHFGYAKDGTSKDLLGILAGTHLRTSLTTEEIVRPKNRLEVEANSEKAHSFDIILPDNLEGVIGYSLRKALQSRKNVLDGGVDGR